MRLPLIAGILLMIAGAAILAHRQFTYQTRETVLEIGPIKATAERSRAVPFQPVIGWGLVAGGAVALALGARTRH